MILMLLRISTSRVSQLWIFELPNSCSAGADIVALGTLWGITAWEGPPIPCRGRRTALGPGPLEVPEPSQDFAAYTEKFRLQGFSPKEMIALVHTIGLVRSTDFPNLVLRNNSDPSGVGLSFLFPFCSATEYIGGMT